MTSAHQSPPAGTLYIVATPIGNLDDISQRALQVLRSVSWVAAEDTRHSGKLLSHFHISARFISLHDHNEKQRAASLLQKLHAGEDVALISDAGTPLISDPGYSLVRLCRDAGVRVVPIPGPCALIAAWVCEGDLDLDNECLVLFWICSVCLMVGFVRDCGGLVFDIWFGHIEVDYYHFVVPAHNLKRMTEPLLDHD